MSSACEGEVRAERRVIWTTVAGILEASGIESFTYARAGELCRSLDSSLSRIIHSACHSNERFGLSASELGFDEEISVGLLQFLPTVLLQLSSLCVASSPFPSRCRCLPWKSAIASRR